MSLIWKSVLPISIDCSLKAILGLAYEQNGNFACARFQLRRFIGDRPIKNGVVITIGELKILYDYFKSVESNKFSDNIECGDFSIFRPAFDEIRVTKKDKYLIINREDACLLKIYLPAYIIIMDAIRGNQNNLNFFIEKLFDCYIYNIMIANKGSRDFSHETYTHRIAENCEHHISKLRRNVLHSLDIVEYDFKQKFLSRANHSISTSIQHQIEVLSAKDLYSISQFLLKIIPTYDA